MPSGTILHDLTLCGWRVLSGLALPELGFWRGDDHAPDLVLRLGTVPDALPEPCYATPFVQIDRGGACRLEIAAVGRFLITGGHEVVIDPRPHALPAEIRSFLLGVGLGILGHQRGLLPLRAAAVRKGDRIMVLAGASRTGKSCLAASLTRNGYHLLADEVVIIDQGVLLPAIPRLKLWGDAVEALGLAPWSLPRNRRGQQRYHLTLPLTGPADARRPSAIYVLADGSVETMLLMDPDEAADALKDQIYRPEIGRALGREPALAGAIAALTTSVPVHRVSYRMGLEHLPEITHWFDLAGAP